jgi:magnesium-transporting ATPase (P-type)
MEETDPMMAMAMAEKPQEEKKPEEKEEKGCCSNPLLWAIIGFFVVLIFIGLCFWKISSDENEKREHAPNEDEKRNGEEN